MMMKTPPGLVRAIGGVGATVAQHAGGMGILAWRTLVALFTGQVSLRDFMGQLFEMGVQSLPLVLVTAILSGIVTSQQGGYQFTGSIPLYVLGSVVTSSVILELGPGHDRRSWSSAASGARITAELGTMQVSEQIDALYSLGRDPVQRAGRAAHPGRHARDAAARGDRQLVGVLAGHRWPPASPSASATSPSSTARGSSGTTGTCSTRS